jgi:hAT family C-terminal dimerisation region
VDKDASDDDEYEAYLAQSNTQTTESALNWWLLNAQRQKWPRLSQMAIDLLSIPAMSGEPERVFSGARRTILWERNPQHMVSTYLRQYLSTTTRPSRVLGL